ncbi:MAG: Rdx family protein [Deltaproteobacteria bacterium]|nr:Rdx family protein [Deltaproteobacteria bacterium]
MPRAASLAAQIKQQLGLETDVRPGSSGQFDVNVAGKTVFSKYEERRFPEPDEVLDAIRELVAPG